MNKILIILWVSIFSICPAFPQSIIFTADDLYEMAIEHSSTLTEKEAKESASGYRVREMSSLGAPTLDFESTLNYIHNPDTLTIEAGSFGSTPFLMPTEDTTFTMSGSSYYDFKIILEQPVFTWGKIHNALEASKEGAAAASIDTLKIKDLLKTEILINITTFGYLKDIRNAVLKQKGIAARLETISKDNYENGMILLTQYLDAQTKRKEVELRENYISEQINQVLLSLIYLTGTELTEGMIQCEILEHGQLGTWQEIYSETLKKNKDLSMLRHGIKAEEYKSKAAKGNYYFKPDLAFHAELSYGGSYFPIVESGWLDGNKGNLTLSIGIKSPIADFGTMYSAIKASEEELFAVRASYENNREQIERFIRKTTYEIDLSKLNILYYEERIATDLKMINQREKEWSSGYGDEIDYLMQQINYYSNSILKNQEQIKLESSYYKLENLAGNINN